MGDPMHQAYHFKRPLLVEVRRQTDHIELLSNEYHVYGVGETVAEAADDLRDMLIETYEELSQSEPKLSKYLAKQLENLRRLITPH
jgi:hypothetical protein